MLHNLGSALHCFINWHPSVSQFSADDLHIQNFASLHNHVHKILYHVKISHYIRESVSDTCMYMSCTCMHATLIHTHTHLSSWGDSGGVTVHNESSKRITSSTTSLRSPGQNKVPTTASVSQVNRRPQLYYTVIPFSAQLYSCFDCVYVTVLP